LSTVIVLIDAPSNPILPSPVIASSNSASTCDVLILDATSSSGNGGRPWSTLSWQVLPTISSININTSAIGVYLLSINSIVSPISIPQSFLFDGSLTIQLTLTNYLQRTLSVSKTIRLVSDSIIPQVVVVGSPIVKLYRNQSLSLYGSAHLPDCASSSSITLKYQWIVMSATADRAFPSIQSYANDPHNFLLSPNSLDVSQRYKIVLNVTSSSKTWSSAAIIAEVLSGGIVAVINGGDIQTTTLASKSSNKFYLDASSSYSVDYPFETLFYGWSCKVVSTSNFGGSCPGFIK
jgi:hypothetical protein